MSVADPAVTKLIVIRNGFAIAVLALWLVQYFGVRHVILTAALWVCFACGALAQLLLLTRAWSEK